MLFIVNEHLVNAPRRLRWRVQRDLGPSVGSLVRNCKYTEIVKVDISTFLLGVSSGVVKRRWEAIKEVVGEGLERM
jgi:hypothetical protein